MAHRARRHPETAPGPWFVDTRCIDCDAARHVAPGLIVRNPSDGVSLFTRQPETPDEIAMAWRAVQVCPTRSVGHETLRRPDTPVFPEPLGDDVYRLGHNARSSFGAHSYLAVRATGNVMVDAPRWTREVADPLTSLGGVDHIVLSHRDDVADAERYAIHFGATVWIHVHDRDAAPFATRLIDGTEPATISDGVVAFPVPGHTRGSVLYLIDDHLLFTGDSLCWDPARGRLHAFRRACWFSWPEQIAALTRFHDSELGFDRLFAGHGWSHSGEPAMFRRALADLLARMPAM